MKPGTMTKEPLRKALCAAAYLLTVFAAALSMTESSGVIRSLPLMLILPAVATLFYNRKRLTCVLCTLLVLILCLVEDGSVSKAVFAAGMAVVFSAAGILMKRLIVTACVRPDKRRLCGILAGVLAVASLAGYALCFGNPVSALRARRENLRYLAETYGDEGPSVRYTVFSPAGRRYYTTVTFDGETSRITARVVRDKQGISDGCRNYYEYLLLSERRGQLERLLAQELPGTAGAALRIDRIDTHRNITASSTVEEFSDKMVFDLAFYTQTPTQEVFVSECKRYADCLKEQGAVYGALHFYGGNADEFLYEMELPCDYQGDLNELVTPFSGESFDRYEKETDYAARHNWRYGG